MDPREQSSAMDDDTDPFDLAGKFQMEESSRGDVSGGPSWPIPASTSLLSQPAPPVGLNWSVVARDLEVDERVLRHDGCIVLTGEYFPAAGYCIVPSTMQARFVDVGDMALSPMYFIGKITMDGFHLELPSMSPQSEIHHPVVHRDTGPIIGLFIDPNDAERAKREIFQGSLGSGVSLGKGPLGTELRVRTTQSPGRVATVMASEGGAIISVSGRAIDLHAPGVAATGR
jgi:hypothetical protein